ncbi:hypothetical protein [Alkalibacillus aidingensis]|uniref:hypothetical protein n=1 Tax=Alkalibacillus aidingensis TaxID=2747607 RepID=UPI0016612068|nr:hypothetical protein [Alkalibacillus aidingensis]
MSDSKKEIHVKDLIIKADNVHFEPPKREPHPLFGPRMMDEEPIEETKEDHHHVEDEVEAKDDKHEEDDRRPPFFWL